MLIRRRGLVLLLVCLGTGQRAWAQTSEEIVPASDVAEHVQDAPAPPATPNEPAQTPPASMDEPLAEPPPASTEATPLAPAPATQGAAPTSELGATQSHTKNNALRLSPPTPPTASATPQPDPKTNPGAPASDRESAHDARPSDDKERDPMNWFGVSVKLGIANVNAGSLKNPTYNETLAAAAAQFPAEAEATGLIGGGACTPIDRRCRTPSRKGFHLGLTLHLGGDGAGWDIEPYYSKAKNAFAVGAYTGPKFDIHIVRPLYFGFGFGFKAAYVGADGWKYGADVFGRIPVHLTLYVTPSLALTVEGSFGAGISLFVSEPVTYTNPATGRPIASAPKISLGTARSWDLSFGVRFP